MVNKQIEDKLNKGIKFGPFSRKHYRDAVNDNFKDLVLTYLKQEVIPKISIEISKIKGQVYAPHDGHPKGELKAYRNKFAFYGRFYQGRVFDEVRFIFFHKVDTNTIKLLNEPYVYTVQQRRNIIHHSKMIDEVVEKFYSGKQEIICPKCSQMLNLTIWDINNRKCLKLISCPTNQCLFVRFNLTDEIIRKPNSLLNNRFVIKLLFWLEWLHNFCETKFWGT